MSAIDGLPHTWGQTFVSGGDALVYGLGSMEGPLM